VSHNLLMLIEFSVGNYRSFKETVTFSMVAAKVSAKDKKLDENNVFTVDKHLSLLKSAGIYGANASGKSNLAKAMGFMRWFMLNSSKETQVTEEIDVESFRLSTEMEEEPSFFEIVFLLNEKIHRYGFKTTKKEIISEWLFYVPTTREAKLFERKGGKISSSRIFKGGNIVKTITRPNALFLSVASQFNVEVAERILTWLKNNFWVTSALKDSYSGYTYTMDCLKNGKYKEEILQIVKNLDLDIENLEIKETQIDNEVLVAFDDLPEEIRNLYSNKTGIQVPVSQHMISVGTAHRKYDEKANLIAIEFLDIHRHESEGTRKLFAMSGLIVDTLKTGRVLLIDELDASLHPIITCAIITLFNSNVTNPNNAQLIFMTHDTNLLSNKIFRRDQIWFTEKDSYGATHLYSLAEYKVRNDASFESDYIEGRYGAVPFIGSLEHLIG
jgi:uncharacterized protein